MLLFLGVLCSEEGEPPFIDGEEGVDSLEYP